MVTSETENTGLRFRLRRFYVDSRAPSLGTLDPYASLSRHYARKSFGVITLILFCFVYGFLFSVFSPTYPTLFAAPIISLVLLVIWALPDVNWAPTGLLRSLFYATFVSLIVWTDYLAISLPGLPWITLLRLTSFPLLLTLLVCISVSAEFRATILRNFSVIPAIPILLGIFVAIQFISIAFSKDVSTSVQKFIVAQTTWTAVFCVSTYIFLRPGEIRRWACILWIMAIFVSLISIWEAKLGHLPWAGHIPSFLKIDDESVESILSPKMRYGTTFYRAQSTFTTPLGLAEYLALALPFVLHFSGKQFVQKVRIAAICSVPLLFYSCYLTNAKLGSIGCLIGVVLYTFGAAYQSWQLKRDSLLAASTMYGYPIGLTFLIGALLASHRFQVLIFGNDGSHAASTDSRIGQYTRGLQKFLEWPFGYGIGMGAAIINPGVPRARVSIDTYYLSVLLEYGVAGFIVYYGMFLIAIWEGARRILSKHAADPDRAFLWPISVSLVVFLVIKSVFSQQDNHPVVFMMLGALMALASTRKRPSGRDQVDSMLEQDL